MKPAPPADNFSGISRATTAFSRIRGMLRQGAPETLDAGGSPRDGSELHRLTQDMESRIRGRIMSQRDQQIAGEAYLRLFSVFANELRKLKAEDKQPKKESEFLAFLDLLPRIPQTLFAPGIPAAGASELAANLILIQSGQYLFSHSIMVASRNALLSLLMRHPVLLPGAAESIFFTVAGLHSDKKRATRDFQHPLRCDDDSEGTQEDCVLQTRIVTSLSAMIILQEALRNVDVLDPAVSNECKAALAELGMVDVLFVLSTIPVLTEVEKEKYEGAAISLAVVSLSLLSSLVRSNVPIKHEVLARKRSLVRRWCTTAFRIGEMQTHFSTSGLCHQTKKQETYTFSLDGPSTWATELAGLIVECTTVGSVSLERQELSPHVESADKRERHIDPFTIDSRGVHWVPLPSNWDSLVSGGGMIQWQFTSAVSQCRIQSDGADLALMALGSLDVWRMSGTDAKNAGTDLSRVCFNTLAASLICLAHACPANCAILRQRGAFRLLIGSLAPNSAIVGDYSVLQNDGAVSPFLAPLHEESEGEHDEAGIHLLLNCGPPKYAEAARVVEQTLPPPELPEHPIWDTAAGLLTVLLSAGVTEVEIDMLMSFISKMRTVSLVREDCDAIETCFAVIAGTLYPSRPFMWFDGRRSRTTCQLSRFCGRWYGYSALLWLQPACVWPDGSMVFALTQPQLSFAVVVIANGKQRCLAIRTSDVHDQSTRVILPGATLTSDVWHHIAYTHNISGFTLYVNGKKVGSVSSIPYPKEPSKPHKLCFAVGGSPDIPVDPFFGKMGPVHLLEGALGERDIEKLVDLGPCSGLGDLGDSVLTGVSELVSVVPPNRASMTGTRSQDSTTKYSDAPSSLPPPFACLTGVPEFRGPACRNGHLRDTDAFFQPPAGDAMQACQPLRWALRTFQGLYGEVHRSSVAILSFELLSAFFRQRLQAVAEWELLGGVAALGSEMVRWGGVGPEVITAMLQLSIGPKGPSHLGDGVDGRGCSFRETPSTVDLLFLVIDVFPAATSDTRVAALKELSSLLHSETNAKFFNKYCGLATLLGLADHVHGTAVTEFVNVIEKLAKWQSEVETLLAFVASPPPTAPQLLAEHDQLRAAVADPEASQDAATTGSLAPSSPNVRHSGPRLSTPPPSDSLHTRTASLGVGSSRGGDCGATPVVAAHVRQHAEERLAQRHLMLKCDVLRMLFDVAKSDSSLIETIIAAGAVSTLMTVISGIAHRSEALRVYALRLLALLIHCHRKTREMFIKGNGYDSVAAALERHHRAGVSCGLATFNCLFKMALDCYHAGRDADAALLTRMRPPGSAEQSHVGSPSVATTTDRFIGDAPPLALVHPLLCRPHTERRSVGGASSADGHVLSALGGFSVDRPSDLDQRLSADDAYAGGQSGAPRETVVYPQAVGVAMRLLGLVSADVAAAHAAAGSSMMLTGDDACLAAGWRTPQHMRSRSLSNSAGVLGQTVGQGISTQDAGLQLLQRQVTDQSVLSPDGGTTTQQRIPGASYNSAGISAGFTTGASYTPPGVPAVPPAGSGMVPAAALAGESLVLQVLSYMDRIVDITVNVDALLPHPWLSWLWDGAKPLLSAATLACGEGPGVVREAPEIEPVNPTVKPSQTPPVALNSISPVRDSGTTAGNDSLDGAAGGRNLATPPITPAVDASAGTDVESFRPPTTLQLSVEVLLRRVLRKMAGVDLTRAPRALALRNLRDMTELPALQRIALEEAFRHCSVNQRLDHLDPAEATNVIRNVEVLVSLVDGALHPVPLPLGIEIVRAIGSIAMHNTSWVRQRMKQQKIFDLRDRLALSLLVSVPDLSRESAEIVDGLRGIISHDSSASMHLLRAVCSAVRARDVDQLEAVQAMLRVLYATDEDQRKTIVRIVTDQEVIEALVLQRRVTDGKEAVVRADDFLSWAVAATDDRWPAAAARIEKLTRAWAVDQQTRVDRMEKEAAARRKCRLAELARRAAVLEKAKIEAETAIDDRATVLGALATEMRAATFDKRLERVRRYSGADSDCSGKRDAAKRKKNDQNDM